MSYSKKHWEEIYSDSEPNEVSWYQEKPEMSLRLIDATGIGKTENIIDVGGGASTLVDHLLDLGFKNLTVLDISAAALERAQKRLSTRSKSINWVTSDVTTFQPKHQFKLWHDRAVFHFLTDEQDRKHYIEVLQKSLALGGHFIIATFAIDGPKKCSGLDIVQYDVQKLEKLFGSFFELKQVEAETHITPWDSEQKFIYCRFQSRR